MDSNRFLAEKKDLITVNKFCSQIIQVNFISKGMSLYFSNESFLECAEAFREASSKFLDLHLADIFKEFDANNDKE